MSDRYNFYIITLLIYLSLISLTTSHPKGDELRRQTLESDGGVMIFSASAYKEYVMKHPRPYDIVVLFTLKYKCHLCDAVRNEFELVAESFREFEGYKPDMVTKKRAVFFAIVYYSDETSTIFKNLKLPSTTSMLYTTPQNIQVDDNGEVFIKYDEDYIIGYKERSDQIHAHKMLEFVNAKSGRKFELKKNPLHFLMYFLIFIGILAVGFYCFQNYKSFFLSPKLWLVGSFAVYIICIGGIVYNMIHGTPFAKFDREGNIVELIHSGQRSQYVGEGLLLSSMFVLGGSVLYAFNWINRIKGYWPHRLAALSLIFFIVMISKLITLIYQKKANWYNPSFFPPYGYIKGPLIKDQGISF